MTHINRKRPNTKLQIVQVAAKLFIEDGFSRTTLTKIAKIMDISTGNLTFHFQTKEHLLAVLVDELGDFQNMLMAKAADEGQRSLLSYCLELTSMAAACAEDEAARDFFTSAYSLPLTLERIRENDTEKTKSVFGEFCPDWTEEQWVATENVVSGIEFATIVTRKENTPLPMQIEQTLNSVMMLYNVPEELRRSKIEKVLAMDYRALGRRILAEFKEYLGGVNEENLRQTVGKN